MAKSIKEILPELEIIAKEMGLKVNNGKVLREYDRRQQK